MFTKHITVAALALTYILLVFGTSQAQESYPWNQDEYRGYANPKYAAQPINVSAPMGQPQKYELYTNVLSIKKNTEDPNAFTLIAHVPENAPIWFDDKVTTSKGATRIFYRSDLAPGFNYSYVVRVAWVEDGKLVSQMRNLSFKPGDLQCVYIIQAGSKIEGGNDIVQANLSNLSADDRKLAENQKYCAVQNGVRLGAMGTPAKVTVQGQPVFLCCEACRDRAQSNAVNTLAKAKELKTKAHDHDHAK